MINELFHKIAAKVSSIAGSPLAFVAALFVLGVWFSSGPAFNYSDTWQLIINTGTTIVTFLMVFLIQNTQNRDAKAIHLKLDELLKALRGARTGMVSVEDLSDNELESLHREFQKLHEHYAKELLKRGKVAVSSDEQGSVEVFNRIKQ